MGILLTAIIFISLTLYVNISFTSLTLNHSNSYLGLLERRGDQFKIIAALPVLIIDGIVFTLFLLGVLSPAKLFTTGYGVISDVVPTLLTISLIIYLFTDYTVRQRKNILEHSVEIIDAPKIYKQAKLINTVNGISLISFGVLCALHIGFKAFGVY